MNSLNALMGLDLTGVPIEQGYAMDDPYLQAGLAEDEAALMAGQGIPPLEDPYAMVGMEAPDGLDVGQVLAQQMMGGPAPQLGQSEVDAIAMALGLNGSNTILEGEQDPMYASQFDVMNYLGGGY